MSALSRVLIRPEELAELFHVSTRTVEDWRRRGVGPVPLTIPGAKGYWYKFDDALACLECYKRMPIGRVAR